MPAALLPPNHVGGVLPRLHPTLERTWPPATVAAGETSFTAKACWAAGGPEAPPAATSGQRADVGLVRAIRAASAYNK